MVGSEEQLVARLNERLRCNDLYPFTRAHDLYAAGITMWEICTGGTPFDDIPWRQGRDLKSDVVAAGFQPNLYEVDDPDARRTITSYLDRGNAPLPEGTEYLPSKAYRGGGCEKLFLAPGLYQKEGLYNVFVNAMSLLPLCSIVPQMERSGAGNLPASTPGLIVPHIADS